MDIELDKSWYTKYRPKNMEEYSGAAIKSVVEKRFNKRENMPHVIMIHGSRGCGKTTFARIISKYYLCLNFSEDGPCEECEMCQSINEILISGESGQVECPGVTEVDATTANGKEAIQEVMEDAMLSPIYGSFKVLILDECHMITAQAQNSLLKLIEDIPPHLVVIFATTDPQKVLQTIKSRCQLTLEAKKQSVDDMVNRLMEISVMEKLKVSPEALAVIVKKANRVPRECINLLESIAKTYAGEVTIDTVKDYIGSNSSDLYIDYFNAANESLSSILMCVKKLKNSEMKLTEFVSGLMGFALDSMYIKHGISSEDYPPEYVKKLKVMFDMYNSSDFDMLLQIIEYLSNQLTAEDDNKNELLLITTAMRISKLNLLANGLAKEQDEAIIENKLSIVEHRKKLKVDNAKALEAQKIDMDLADIKEDFSEATQIVNTYDLMQNVQVSIPDIPSLDASNDDKVTKISISEDVDDFLDN